jgi:quinohemoprotein ethanol dehydrogenase
VEAVRTDSVRWQIPPTRLASALSIVVAVLGFTAPPCGARAIDDAALANDADGSDWPAFGRSFSEQRHSPLRQIDAGNVARLGLAWSLDLPGVVNVASQPLAVDGVLYLAIGHSVVHAVDARTGKLLWRHDPEVAKHAGHKLRGAWGSRGLAFYRDRVYVATLDGRLIALSAASGEPVWSVLTVEPDDARYITGAPRVFGGKVLIGHAGADNGPVRGYVTAYDTETGRQLWRFHIVPGNPADGFENAAMEMAARTWTGEWWKHGGGGTVWNAISYDPELDRVYLGTGNGAPWNQKIRSPGGGDNLFLCSVLALDADTGAYRWHYQTTPGETWDYNSAMDMVLATLPIDGEPRKLLLHAPKNGFFYVIDRETGKLVSAEKIGKVTWAERVDAKTGRPVEVPGARYEDGQETVWPGPAGVHNWQPMAFHPGTGLVYVPTMELPGFYDDRGVDPATWRHRPNVLPSAGVEYLNDDAPLDAGRSELVAWDPLARRAAWKRPTPGVWNGGVISTAGNLVFQGQIDGHFKAYAADTGEELWSFAAGNAVIAPPLSFSVDGRQLVAVLAGVSGTAGLYGSLSAQFGWQARRQPRRLLAFALDAKAKLPASPPPERVAMPEDPGFEPDAQQVARGARAYGQSCLGCHGPAAISGGGTPDLRASPITRSAPDFDRVVRAGALEELGMPRFAEFPRDEIEAIRHYLLARAREERLAAQRSAP